MTNAFYFRFCLSISCVLIWSENDNILAISNYKEQITLITAKWPCWCSRFTGLTEYSSLQEYIAYFSAVKQRNAAPQLYIPWQCCFIRIPPLPHWLFRSHQGHTFTGFIEPFLKPDLVVWKQTHRHFSRLLKSPSTFASLWDNPMLATVK